MRDWVLWTFGFAVAFALGALLGGAFLRFGDSDSGSCPHCIGGSVQAVFSPDSGERIIGLVAGANESIDLEMYLFNYKPLAEELVRAKNRGVAVRVILEPRLTDNPNLEMMEYLRQNGIEARWASLEYKLTHAKAMIVDGKEVLVGSTNWSASALGKNREYSVLIDDVAVTSEFETNFEKDWEMADTGKVS